MLEMQTVVTDDRGVRPSVSLSVTRLTCVRRLRDAFVKLLWFLVVLFAHAVLQIYADEVF